MIDLVTAGQVAGILGNAVKVVDTVYDRFFKVKSGSEPPPGLQAQHSVTVTHDAQRKALVAERRGQEVQLVKYDDLAARLLPSDLSYIRAREKTMEQYKSIWERAYPEVALESDPIRKAQLELKLKNHTDALGGELASILDFLQQKCGMMLDDHYLAFRDLAGRP